MRWGWLAAIVLLLGTAIALAAPAQRELGELIRCGAYDQFPMREQQAPERDQGPDLVERGRQLVERAECGRCHALPATVAATPRQRSCAGCHAWIHGTGADPAAAAQQRRRYPIWVRPSAKRLVTWRQIARWGGLAAGNMDKHASRHKLIRASPR